MLDHNILALTFFYLCVETSSNVVHNILALTFFYSKLKPAQTPYKLIGSRGQQNAMTMIK